MAAHVPRAPAGADYSRPAPARIYDYMLRGDNHFEPDILAAERILSAVPEIRDCAWSNRGFHQRAIGEAGPPDAALLFIETGDDAGREAAKEGAGQLIDRMTRVGVA